MSKAQIGNVKDMGQVLVIETWLVKGWENWTLRFKLGAPTDVPPWKRPLPGPSTPTTTPERIDLLMDLQADKQVALAATFTDELGHAVPAPEGTSVTWSNDNETVIALTTNEDGSANAAATGELGNATVSVQVDFPNGRQATGDLLISVVPGDAERVAILPGDVTEVTPDTPPAPEEPAPTEPTPTEPAPTEPPAEPVV